ncbi:hypothetical protein [Alkalitalea saponilacus]|uniref:Uncharacterized protein n=1 Tax=Alkalitalea saponilacus TaxID=889453 RepID=A0A1T5EYK3_9BACT|nr:hypothetical protein [Alkalitalea saponilacus]ASB47965.1 hypothetical protein CDL62_01755 [Alkalitalea saponilacus]SKB89023.1 hypothetical protein SAMN03080601_01464 [Alkalitalea saponilacus]
MDKNLLYIIFIFLSFFNITAQEKEEILILLGEKISHVKMPVCITEDTITEPDILDIFAPLNNVNNEADFHRLKQLFFPDDTLIVIGLSKQQYLARYKVIKMFTEHKHIDTVEFITYVPELFKYEHALLFLKTSKNGCFSLVNNQFVDIYLDKNNKWASHYASLDYTHPNNIHTSLKPVKIDFTKEISFDITDLDNATLQERYPSKYYIFINNKAIAVWGNYIEDVIELKMNAIFGD